MVNPRLKWERSLKRNFGVDFGFWNDRVNGSADIYYDTTNDLVMTIAKPDHIGFSNAKENLGKIRNSGVELSLRGNVLRRSRSNLNLYLNMSHNRNRIVEISDYLKNKNRENEESAVSSLPAAFYEEGESMTALKVMRSAGINPANGREVFIRRDGQLTYEYDYREKQVVGDTTPKVQGSFGFSFGWRAFDLSATFAYRLGATVYNQTLRTKVEGTAPTGNADRRCSTTAGRLPATGRSTRTSPAGKPRLRPTGSSQRSMPLKVRRSNSPIRCRTASAAAFTCGASAWRPRRAICSISRPSAANAVWTIPLRASSRRR